MSVAHAVPTSRQDSSSRWLLGSLALNLFFVGVAIAIAVRAPALSYWDRDVFVRVELLATALSPTDADILHSQINANRAVIEDTPDRISQGPRPHSRGTAAGAVRR